MVDTSFYKELGEEQTNPLKALSDLQSLKNAQLQNKRGQVALSNEQAQLAMQQYNYLNKVMGDLSAKARSPEGISQKEMIAAGVNAAAGGIITHDQLNNFISNMGEDTPQNNATTIANMQYKIQDAAKQHAITYGTGVKVDTGAQQGYGVIQDPQYGGRLDIASTVNNELTPQDKTALIENLNAKNETVATPKGQIFTNTGEVRGAPVQPSQSEIAARNVPELPASPAPVELRTRQAPGAASDMEEQAKQGVALQHLADSVPQRKALLQELEEITKSGNVNFGPGSDKWNKIVSGAQRLYGGDSKSVSQYDTFNKLATQLAQKQFQDIGGTGTDTKLGSAISASPNTALSNRSNAEIIALLKGNEDAIKIKNSEWQRWKKKNGAGDYAAFSADFNNKFDPRVFQAQYMSPADRKSMIRALSPDELKQYKTDYQVAGENGWIK